MTRKKVYVNSAEEFKEILRVVYEYNEVVYGPWEPHGKYSLATHAFIEDNMVNIEVTSKYVEYALHGVKKFVPCTYIFRKDGQTKTVIDPAVCYATLQKYYKAPDMTNADFGGLKLEKNEKGSFILSAKPLVGYNPKFDKQEQRMWVYDLNSAYAAVMRNSIPDTEHPLYNGEPGMVHKGREVGFMLCDGLPIVMEGYAEVVFPLITSPYKPFAEKYYGIKKNSKDPLEKAKAKQMLVYSVGYLQRHNPFIRSYIVNRCNNYIKSKIDENTAMWNTDAIYSLVPRPDLKIGSEIGQFKLEHDGVYIRHVRCNYQVVGGETTYRGIPKTWFKEDWNMLTDVVPGKGNIYRLNHETLELEDIENEI